MKSRGRAMASITTLLLSILGGCAPPRTDAAPAGSRTAVDSAVDSAFAVAAAALVDSSASMLRILRGDGRALELAFDARPLARSTSADAMSDAIQTIADLSLAGSREATVVARRRTILRAAGLSTGDLDALRGCPMVMSLAETQGHCPAGPIALAALGLPEPVQDGFAFDAIVVSADSHGRNAIKTRLEMKRGAHGWRLAGKSPSIIVE